MLAEMQWLGCQKRRLQGYKSLVRPSQGYGGLRQRYSYAVDASVMHKVRCVAVHVLITWQSRPWLALC